MGRAVGESGRTQRLKVLSAGIACLLLSLGVARFAYTPLLPLMQAQAGLSVPGAGWLAATNYAGYLGGAVAASLIGSPALKDRVYRLGMLVALASTLVMGLTDSFALWAVARFFAGLSTAAGMLVGTGLVLNWLVRNDHPGELGIHFAGIGLGIAGCAALVELLSPGLDWRQQWFVFSGVGLLLLAPALGWMPRASGSEVTAKGQALEDRPPSSLYLRLFMAAYFCAGMGFVITATFLVATVERLPNLEGRGNLAFLLVGLAAAPATMLWDRIARRFGDLNALIAASALHVAGTALPVVAGGLAMTMLGAVLFGVTFVGLVSLVLTMAGRFYPTHPAKMMGKMTLTYGVAQVAGPSLAAYLAAHYGGYAAAFYMAAGAMTAGALLLLALKLVESRASTAGS